MDNSIGVARKIGRNSFRFAFLAFYVVSMNISAQIRSNAPVFVAALPMYEVSPAVQKADDIFWTRLREKLAAQGVNAPKLLERSTEELMDQWTDANLFLSQTCGYPFTHVLARQGVKIVGTPVYSINDGLPAGEYRSVIIVNAESSYKTLADLKGKKAGINEADSNSGMNAFRAAVADAFSADELAQGIFESVVQTGGHGNSVRMVANGQIDVAAIDNVSYALITRDYPELAARTRILTLTSTAPGLPLITSARTDDATVWKMRSAIKDILSEPKDGELRWALREMKISDFVVIDPQVYQQRIQKLEQIAQEKGYPLLR